MGGSVRLAAVKRNRDEGFSLVEVLVAMMVFAFVAMGATSGFITEIALEHKSRNRVTAAALAASDIDLARSTPPSDLVLGSDITTSPVINGTTFTIQRDVAYLPLNSTQGACDGGANNGATVQIYRVTTTVTWPRMGTTSPVRADTQISPESEQAANTYNIGIKVLDEFNEGVNARPVRLSGPSGTFIVNTTSDGCAFFVGLVAGTYDAEVRAAGWVDNQLAAVATASVTVPSGTGTTVTSPVNYTPSAQLTLTVGDVLHPVPANVPLSLNNPSLVPETRVAAGTGAIRIIGPSNPFGLFPYEAGYQAWLGSCGEADPQGESPFLEPIGPYYPDALRQDAMTVTAGNNTNGSIAAGTLELRFTDGANMPITGVSVTAHHPADGSLCNDVVYPLTGVSDAAGYLGATLPYGTWELTLSGLPIGATTTPAFPDCPCPPNTRYAVTLSPGDPPNAVNVLVTP